MVHQTIVYLISKFLFCNLDKGFTILDSVIIESNHPIYLKDQGSVVFGQALPLSLIQIYSHETRCPQSPAKEREFLGSIYGCLWILGV